MKKELRDKKIQVLITTAGTLVILLAAIFCYRTVEQTIVDNEKESIISIAKVSAHSFEETLQAILYMRHYPEIWRMNRILNRIY